MKNAGNMEIVVKNVEDLIPYENNPRNNENAVKYVAESIRQFGFKVPIIVDADDIVVAGHTRLKAAKELGITEVPCVVADDLTEEQVRAFRLADNKVAEIASWDSELLDFELGEIDGFNMDDFGFIELSDIDVDDFFEEPEPKEEKEEEKKEVQCPHCGMYFVVD